MARTLGEREKELYIENRDILHEQLSELQADFEDLSDEELVKHRRIMRQRINLCLSAILETDRDNLE